MARIAPVPADRMDEAQRRYRERVMAAGRRADTGPWAAWQHAPEIGEKIAGIVEHLMSETRVSLRLKELAILVIARAYTAQYEWAVHAHRARGMGLEEDIITALRQRRRPDYRDPADALVHDMTAEFLEQRRLRPELYAQARERFGEPALVELITHIGFYIAVAVMVVAFEFDVPAGVDAPLDP